jgi:hypothetical protein
VEFALEAAGGAGFYRAQGLERRFATFRPRAIIRFSPARNLLMPVS